AQRGSFRLIVTRHQLAAQKLADRRFGNVLDEDVTPWPLEARQARRPAELIELVGLDGCAALDESRDDLAPALVSQADDRHLRYRRMQRQAALDLDRRDVLTAGNDHVVHATGDE